MALLKALQTKFDLGQALCKLARELDGLVRSGERMIRAKLFKCRSQVTLYFSELADLLDDENPV